MTPITRRGFLGSGCTLSAVMPRLLYAARRSGMKLGLVTYQWAKDMDLPTLLAACEKSGLLGAELRTQHAHGVEPSLNKVQRAEVRERFSGSSVELVGYGSNCDFHHTDPALVPTCKSSRNTTPFGRGSVTDCLAAPYSCGNFCNLALVRGNVELAKQYERTYIAVDQKLVNLNSADRGGPPDGIRSHYLVAGARPISVFSTEPFWGKLSKVVATEPWIATTSVSGTWTVALWWEKAAEVFQNSDERNRCIHSEPRVRRSGPPRVCYHSRFARLGP